MEQLIIRGNKARRMEAQFSRTVTLFGCSILKRKERPIWEESHGKHVYIRKDRKKTCKHNYVYFIIFIILLLFVSCTASLS